MMMVMYTKEIGKMIKHMEKEFIFIRMDQAILDNGLKMFSMDMEFKNGQTVHLIKEIINMVIKMGMGDLHGKMVLIIKEIL